MDSQVVVKCFYGLPGVLHARLLITYWPVQFHWASGLFQKRPIWLKGGWKMDVRSKSHRGRIPRCLPILGVFLLTLKLPRQGISSDRSATYTSYILVWSMRWEWCTPARRSMVSDDRVVCLCESSAHILFIIPHLLNLLSFSVGSDANKMQRWHSSALFENIAPPTPDLLLSPVLMALPMH